MLSVFWHFLVLGLYSFGGPAAHIGYFQRAFVEDKKWLTSSEFNQAVALCQFLPGPASSQLGMFIGYKKGHYLGALAAFVGFTLPSFVLLTILAVMSSSLSDSGWLDAVIQAAKLLAVIVVADALWGMGKKNITSKTTFFVCLLTAIWVYFSVGLLGQILPILAAAVIGYALSFVKKGQNEATQLPTQLPKVKPNLVILSCFCILLVGMPFIANILPIANIFNIFYQAGSFVFGGGHVVLPLLQP
ncbi:chromate transporter, partial [Photobacterium damselae]